jgi:hypothetical protein
VKLVGELVPGDIAWTNEGIEMKGGQAFIYDTTEVAVSRVPIAGRPFKLVCREDGLHLHRGPLKLPEMSAFQSTEGMTRLILPPNPFDYKTTPLNTPYHSAPIPPKYIFPEGEGYDRESWEDAIEEIEAI